MRKIYVFFLIFIFGSATILAQNNPNYEKKVFQDTTGTLFWNKELPVYISLSTSPDGEKHNLKSKDTKYDNPFFLDTEGKNLIRTRWAVDKNTKKAIYPQTELTWEIWADGKAPVSKIHFSQSPKYLKNKQIIYGKGLTATLSAKDAVSGIQYINYSLDNNFQKYNNSQIDFNKEGENTIKYFAADNVGNTEEIKSKSFNIDITPPETVCNVTGVNLGENNVISSATKIYFDSKDSNSGVASTYYKIDEGKLILYNDRDIPIKFLKDGEHVLKFYSIDNVKNQESEQSYTFYLDKTAPITASDVLGDRFIVGDQIYFSGRTKLKLTAVDNKSGVKEVLYSVDGGEFQNYTDPFYMPSKPGLHIVKYYALDNTENITQGDYNSKYMEYAQ